MFVITARIGHGDNRRRPLNALGLNRALDQTE
jgi:hypothetical protein